jgi:ribonucleoside-diphosphate reductase alpha chain
LPDGLARALAEYLGETPAAPPLEAEITDDSEPPAEGQLLMRIGDLCPECGSAALVAEEGCRKCHTCGYSEC